jgi:23S rRNA (guanosine2251-2'-O)-methyltransferase
LRTDRRDRPGARNSSFRAERPPARQDISRPDGDLLYGRNAVSEALAGRRRLRTLLLAEGIKEDDRTRRLLETARRLTLPIEIVPRFLLDQRTAGANHQGVALETAGYVYSSFDDIVENPRTVLILDHLQDPQNFGTLLRAAEATGVSGVIIPRDRTVDITPAVVNASSGAVEHLRVIRVPNLARAIGDLKEAGWWSAALDTGNDAVDLFNADIPLPLALVVGAEGEGVSANVRRHCDLVLSLPMVGRVASLNAATAGSIALFEVLRRGRG